MAHLQGLDPDEWGCEAPKKKSDRIRCSYSQIYYQKRKNKKAGCTSVGKCNKTDHISAMIGPNTSDAASTVEHESVSMCAQESSLYEVASESLKLPEAQAYAMELMIHSGYIFLAENTFALQEVDQAKSQLKKHHYRLIQRSFKVVAGVKMALWTCSCDKNHTELVSGLPEVLDTLTFDVSPCLHTSAAKLCIPEFPSDDHAYSHISKFVMAPNHDATVIVYHESNGCPPSFGVVRLMYKLEGDQDPYLQCTTCAMHTCFHVKHTKTSLALDEPPPALDELKFILNSPPSIRHQTERVALFRSKMPPISTGQMEKKVDSFSPPTCSICEEESYDPEYTCTVYYTDCYKKVSVYSRLCKCGHTKYDGSNDHHLHMGHYALSNALLHKYLRRFVLAGMPMNTFHRLYLQDLLEVTGVNMKGEFVYSYFRLAVREFLRMVDIDEKAGFSCPECGPIPKRPTFDGQTLSFPRHLMLQHMHRKRPQEKDALCLSGSFQERVFVGDKSSRVLLKLYATNDQLLDREALVNKLNLHQPHLVGFVEANPQCPVYAQRLIKDLSSASSVCALLLPEDELLRVAQRMAHEEHLSVDDLQTLHQFCRPLFHCQEQGRLIEPALGPVILEMCRISQEPFKIPEHCLKDTTLAIPMACYPNMPVMRERGTYFLDAQRDDKLCKKDTKGHPTLFPGVFNTMCEHGICMGFELMMDHESPNALFTILQTRYPTAPEYVVYDNACNASSYCLNRNPTFFKHTRFVSDRLHHPNHKNCSSGHDISSYSLLRNYNSQVAEQRQSRLLILKSMLSYTDSESFMLFLKYYHWAHNCIKLGNKASQFPEHFGKWKQIVRRN